MNKVEGDLERDGDGDRDDESRPSILGGKGGTATNDAESDVQTGGIRARSLTSLTCSRLLQCPCCKDGILEGPVTLKCGHTICGKHFQGRAERGDVTTAYACPVASCRGSAGRGRERVGEAVLVPVSAIGMDGEPIERPQPVVYGGRDVTVARVIGLCERATKSIKVERHDQETREELEATGEDGKESLTGLGTLSQDNVQSFQGDNQTLSLRGGVGTSADLDVEEEFRRLLLEQFVCEICFSLLHQPITTPCQHVSELVFGLYSFYLQWFGCFSLQ